MVCLFYARNVMKWFTILTIFIGVAELFVGGSYSSGMEQDKSGPAFRGKKWEEVYITEDNAVYSFDGKRLKKWNFEGIEATDCENISEKKSNVFFTNDYCYVQGNKIVVTYPMNSESEKKRIDEMKEPIQRFAASEAGYAVLTKGKPKIASSFVTVVDSKGKPADKHRLHINGQKGVTGIFLLNSGELIYSYDSGISVFSPSENWKKIATFKTENVNKILKKTTPGGHFVVARDNQTFEHKSWIHVEDKESGKSKLSISSMDPHAWDLDGTALVVAGDESERPTIKLYDLTTEQETYKGTTDGISGECAVRLQGSKVYFVGNKPKPRSTIIDTREKSSSESERYGNTSEGDAG